MARRSRAEMSAANRRAVLDAARRQFESLGYHGASLEGIAEEAELSKGAVYSRFDSKDDLFLAVLEDHIDQRAAATASRLQDLDVDADMATLARLSIDASLDTMAWQAALLEFRARAWRDPAINARYRELHRRTIDSIAAFITEVFRRRGETPPRSARELAIFGLAGATGVVTELMADPELDVSAMSRLTAFGLGTDEPRSRAASG